MEDNPPVPRRRKEDMPSGRLRKGLYILPSLFTTANIAAGYYAILQVVHGSLAEPWHLDNAAKAIGFAILFDGLDGRIARMTKTSSDFGRELDSLADVIAFGLAPALLGWMWGFRLLAPGDSPNLHTKLLQLGAIASFLFVMAGYDLVISTVRSWAPAVVIDAVRYMSFLEHFRRITEGVLEFPSIVFFVSLIVFCLWLNIQVVDVKKAA